MPALPAAFPCADGGLRAAVIRAWSASRGGVFSSAFQVLSAGVAVVA
jgi:hypothetical protein